MHSLLLFSFRSERVYEEHVDLRFVSWSEKHFMTTVSDNCEVTIFGCVSCEAVSLLFKLAASMTGAEDLDVSSNTTA